MSRYGDRDGKWCRVEIMGHVEHIARAQDVDVLGGKMLRVCDETEPQPIDYGLGAIFSLRWLTEEEGEKQGGQRLAAWEEQGRRHVHYAAIGAIQDTIRRVVFGVKMAPDTIEAQARQSHPAMTAEDFAEALEGVGLSETEVDGVKMLWDDPTDIPW